jgi:sugar/nucleoside kinase (ribokinase family)
LNFTTINPHLNLYSRYRLLTEYKKGYFSFWGIKGVWCLLMYLAGCKKELVDFLAKGRFKDFSAVVMPDYFLDRLISLDWNVNEFSDRVSKVATRKGGSIDGIMQQNLRGGNAINTAAALSMLGAKAFPIVCTSLYGLEQIKFHLRGSQVDLFNVKVQSKASITTALEFNTDGGRTNVMLRDLGSLADFGPEDLSESDFKLIGNADYVCLFNWAGTLRHGTDLALRVFEKTKLGGGKTYYDTADPTPNRAGIADLMDKVLKTSLVDVLSVNENEAFTYAEALDASIENKKAQLSFADLALEAARVLSKHLHARIDLHTTSFSATLTRNREVVVPTFKVQTLRATGAGDAWNAGNIFADANGLSDHCRLMLANAVSACYLADPDGMHPTLGKLSAFINGSVLD